MSDESEGAPEAPKGAEKTGAVPETNWILKIGQAVTVLGAAIGIVVGIWGLRDKAENEKIAADFNLKAELAKEAIAEKQLQVQEEEYRRQHSEHIADAERKRISDENEKVSTLLTDLFKSDSGSEGVLATLTSYADGAGVHADAVAEAIQAKLDRTTSLSDVEISFQLLERLGPRAIDTLATVNRNAKLRYDDLLFKAYDLALAMEVRKRFDGDRPATESPSLALLISATTALDLRQGIWGAYEFARVNNKFQDGPKDLDQTWSHERDGNLVWKSKGAEDHAWQEFRQQYGSAKDLTNDIDERLRVAKAIIDGSVRAMECALRKPGVNQAIDLHDTYLGDLYWPEHNRVSINFAGAYIDSKSRHEYSGNRFSSTSLASLGTAYTTYIGVPGPEHYDFVKLPDYQKLPDIAQDK